MIYSSTGHSETIEEPCGDRWIFVLGPHLAQMSFAIAHSNSIGSDHEYLTFRHTLDLSDP